MAFFNLILTLVLLDFVSLRLYPLEYLFELLSLKRYYLVIIVDLLHLLDLLPLCL